LAKDLRQASENISREMPLKSILMPTSVPMAQMVLKGHVLQIIMARIRVTTPSRIIQARPLRVIWKARMISITPSIMR